MKKRTLMLLGFLMASIVFIKCNTKSPRKEVIKPIEEVKEVVNYEAIYNSLVSEYETGYVKGKDNKRVLGMYPKYKLITSHSMRRTFATNLYGKLPTMVIMAITGHTTERSFLTYIKKPQRDFAEQLKRILFGKGCGGETDCIAFIYLPPTKSITQYISVRNFKASNHLNL